MPTLTLALLSRATAQVATPTDFIAVVEFVNRKETGTEYGSRTSSAIIGELSKIANPNVELIPKETIDRAIATLGVASPPQQFANLMRVGQEARATKLITGEVVDYRINKTSAGKSANVSIRVVVYDVASQLPVNGAVAMGTSTVRPDSTDDKALINDAILQAGSLAVSEIRGRVLPYGTVLNTTTGAALVNQGSRSGFKSGQMVIVKRNGIQVATAKVTDVEFDSSVVKPERVQKGIRPGDRVEVVFDVPEVLPGFALNGQPKTVGARKQGNSSGLITTLLVLGLIGFLVSNKGSEGVSSVKAESYVDATLPLGSAAILISWSGDAFSNAGNTVAWQIWRNDFQDVPIGVVESNGARSYVTRSTDQTTETFQWTSSAGIVKPVPGCTTTFGGSTAGKRPLVIGAPYQFSVNVVQAVDENDIPGANGTATTSTNTTATGGTATGGTATGATATGTTRTGTSATGVTGGLMAAEMAPACYTVSDRQSAKGLATALTRPTLSKPDEGAQIQGNQVFSFIVTGSGAYAISLEAKLEFSSDLNFPKNRTFTVQKKQVPFGTSSFPTIDVSSSGLPSYIQNATTVYWRVGIRNTQDNPGPRPERSDWDRYVFSAPRSYKPPVGPPPPPL
jgi:hypothetical protein